MSFRAPTFQFWGIFVRWQFQKSPLSCFERDPSCRQYNYSRMTEKRQGPTPGVCLWELSILEVSIRGGYSTYESGGDARRLA